MRYLSGSSLEELEKDKRETLARLDRDLATISFTLKRLQRSLENFLCGD